MSYSYSVPAGDDPTLFEGVDPLIAALPDGPGKDEAERHRSAVLDGIANLALAEGYDLFTASVSGHGGEGYTSLSLSVTRTAAEAEPS